MTVHYFNRFADGDDMSALDAALAAQLRGQRDKLVENLENLAGAQYNLTPEPYGGFRRVVAATLAGDSGDVFVLDDEMDWRDRMLFIVGPSSLSALQVLYPGHEDDGLINTGSAAGLVSTSCYYTGTGYAAPGGSAGNNYHKLYGSADIQLYAASSSGELRVELGATTQIAINVQIYAGPKMNARGATVGEEYVTTATLYDAADGAAIEPHDLNNFQDALHVGQVKGADTIALGPVGRGDPQLPYEWTVRGETVRQRLNEPALRRYVSGVALIDELTLLDDSFDWRDRFVWAAGVFSLTVDRRPGETSDSGNGNFSVADSEVTFLAGYTGDGDDGSDHAATTDPRYTLRQLGTIPVTPFFLYADSATGYLYMSTFDPSGSSGNADTDSFSLMVFASPRIGPRSKGVGPDKLEADLPSKKVVGTLVDSANSDLTNIVARYRMDRGLVLDGGKVAVIADQSGNGHHLRQLDPALRTPAPVTRTGLNSQLCIGCTGTEYYESIKALPASANGYFVGMVLEPTATIATFEPWSAQLPVSVEGDIVGRIAGTQVDGEWVPNATASPPFKHSQVSGTYSAIGLGVGWNFEVDADPARLAPSVSVRRVGGSAVASVLVSTSPASTGAADVQGLVWRLLEGFRGYVAEIIICDAGQAAADDFHTSADIVSRYSF